MLSAEKLIGMKRQKSNIVHSRVVQTLKWLPSLLIAFVLGCQGSADNKSTEENPNSNKDYFSDKVEVNHSIGFDVEYHQNYKVLHFFRHYNDVVDTVSYTLLQKGTTTPELDYPVIDIPVENVVSVSTTHLGFFKLLDAVDNLKGIETKQYVSSQSIKDAVEKKQIIEVSPAGALNVESVINLNTDVMLAVGFPNSQNEGYQQLERVDIPVLFNADWQEKNLLGRAEWVKLLAVLLNKEKLVNEKFKEIEDEYNSVLKLVENKIVNAPLTITGIAMGDAWHVAGGRSFAYHLLELVKADYPWKNDRSTGSIKLDFETVYEFGLRADFWMAPGSAKSMKEVLQRDGRYADFKSFKEGHVYNIFGRYTEGGGNDYYEQGVIEPHIVLKDIVKIFHPELLPNHKLVYHTQLK